MPFVPFPNTAQVNMVCLWDDQRVENVFHVEQATPFDQVSLAVMGALFRDWWDTNLKPIVPSNISLILIALRALDSESAPAIDFTTNLPLAGTATGGNTLPNNVTVAIKWTTELRGRSFRGRTFHIGLREDVVVGSRVDASFVPTLIAKYQALLDDLEGLNAELVVASRISNGNYRTQGVTTAVKGLFVDPIIDSQRRRLPSRGR